MPNRILKESICLSDSIDTLSWFEEVLFYRLIVSCDDYGRFDGRAAIIKNRLFPLKENLTLKTVSAAINTLASKGLVALYEFESRPYLYLPTWNEHQSIRAKKSKYPSPEDGEKAPENSLNESEIICKQMQADASKCPRNPIQSESNPNPKRNPNPNPKRASAVSAYLDRINPSASQLSLEELGTFADEMGPDVCGRAMDIALDNKVATWPYVRAILRKWQSLGVKCLADIERLDKKQRKECGADVQDPAGDSGKAWTLSAVDLD